MNLRRRDQHGFALLVLLGVVGVGSVGLLLAVQAFLPTLRERSAAATDSVQIAAKAARVAFRLGGAFPADLDALAAAAGLPVDGAWRRDPYGSAAELDYRVTAGGATLRSRGPDGRLGTADDIQCDVGTEVQLRVRQRLRLRMLRAVLLRSSFLLAGTMSVGEEAQMRDALRGYAVARRRWWTADVATRLALTAEMATHVATITALRSLHGLAALPTALTGAGGLMSQLGVPDARGFDGQGVAFANDPVLGWVALGADGTGGTDDDM